MRQTQRRRDILDEVIIEFDQTPRYRRSNADKLMLALFIALISAGILWFVT